MFSNPRKVAHALSSSHTGKYILDGETHALGNCSALIIVVYEHNCLKMPDLSEPSFLAYWEVTCRRADKDTTAYSYNKVGLLGEDTNMEEIQEGFKTLDGGECVELSWIPSCLLLRTTTGRWLHLKVRGALTKRLTIFRLTYQTRPLLLPLQNC